jgi:hypothetical protein
MASAPVVLDERLGSVDMKFPSEFTEVFYCLA